MGVRLTFILLSSFLVASVLAQPHVKLVQHKEPEIGKKTDQDLCIMSNESGEPCNFPFIYHGGTFTNCTTATLGRSWCSLTPNFDEDGRRAYCTGVLCPNCKVYTENGHECQFPFTYKGVEHKFCTNRDGLRPWCLEKTGRTGYCAYTFCGENCRIRQNRRYWNGGYCHLPFTYGGVTYDSCTLKDNRRLWCSATKNYIGYWGVCIGQPECD